MSEILSSSDFWFLIRTIISIFMSIYMWKAYKIMSDKSLLTFLVAFILEVILRSLLLFDVIDLGSIYWNAGLTIIALLYAIGSYGIFKIVERRK
jgi:hypothetical protein